MRGLNGRRFLVCGGASGIGEATARYLVEEGARVIIADRSVDALARLAKDLGQGTEAYTYEQSDPDSVAALFEVVDRGGPINGVAIVAGVHPGSVPIAEITASNFSNVHDVNALGALFVLQAAVNAVPNDMRSAIVVVGSVAGLRPQARDAIYASSKASVQAIVRSTALEYASRGVRVNAVLPGWAVTPLAVSFNSVAQINDRSRESIPMQRPATAPEVASAIAFLLSDDASYITATELVVDGGLAAARPS